MGDVCVLCAGQAHEVVSRKDRRGADLVTVLCKGCGVLRNDPIPSEAELERFYRRDYRQDYKGTAEPRLRQVWRNLDRLNGHFMDFRDVYCEGRLAGGRWLDMGAGSGEFLYLAQHLGAEATGIEPNEAYAAYCRDRLALPVQTGRMEEFDFGAGRFDLIRLSHVLEHLRDPVAALERLAGWLAPDGVIYIEVPDIEKDAQHKLRGRMFHYGHIYNYNPVTLRQVAARAGLVELPATAARSAGTCGAFFLRGEGGAFSAAELAANAARMAAAMAGHQGRLVPTPARESALGRFFATMAKRLAEARQGARLGSHRAIAEAAAARLTTQLRQV